MSVDSGEKLIKGSVGELWDGGRLGRVFLVVGVRGMISDGVM